MNTYTPDKDVTRQPEIRPVDRWDAQARPMTPDDSVRAVGVGVNPAPLWAGGMASAVVAGLVALVGVLVSRWLFKVPVLAPAKDGAFGDVRTVALILVSMAAALAATGLVQLLMLSTLRPRLFFGWIVGLVTAIMVIFPFSTTAALDAKIATAVVNLAIGITIGTLVNGVAARSVPRPQPTSAHRLSLPNDRGL